MATQTSARKGDIQFLNILFCLLVVFIHISSEIILYMDHGERMYWTVTVLSQLTQFVVPGFLMLSGLKCFLNAKDFTYKKFYLSRIRNILIPYIIWVTIYYLYFCKQGIYTFSLDQLRQFLFDGSISAQFYFIVILVQFYILMPVWRTLFRYENPSAVLVVTLLITVLGNTGLPEILTKLWPGIQTEFLNTFFTRYLFFWAMGCMIGLHYQDFQTVARARWMQITILFVSTLVLTVYTKIAFIHALPYWFEFVHILYSFSAILFFFMLSQILFKPNQGEIRFLSRLDRATYSIYLSHCLVIILVNQYFDQNGITDLATRYGKRAIFVYVISIGLGLILQGIKRVFSRG